MNRFFASAVLALGLGAPLAAQTFPIKFVGQHSSHFKGRSKVAIASYGINYVVAQKGSAVAGVGLNTKVATGLSGVDEATMRRLANEAYADLRAQLSAAGIALVSEADTRAVIQQAGTKLLPGNTEDYKDGGITIGKSVKKASVAFGAEAAPLTDIFPASGKSGGFGMLGAIGKIQKLGGPGKAMDAVLLFPLLTIDYADTEAKTTRTLTGGKRGVVETNIAFGVRAMSPVNIINPAYTYGAFSPKEDVWSDVPFHRGAKGVSATATNYTFNDDVAEQKAGNVVVDPEAWAALVRQAYKDYNAAIVAVILKEKTA
jgi:hypothetical protein